jgi:hypothetical protein
VELSRQKFTLPGCFVASEEDLLKELHKNRAKQNTRAKQDAKVVPIFKLLSTETGKTNVESGRDRGTE